MGTNYNPKIVTDGLVLYLDAGNTNSYNYSTNPEVFIDLALYRIYVFYDENLDPVHDPRSFYLFNPGRFSVSLKIGYVSEPFIDIKTVVVFIRNKSGKNYVWLEGIESSYFLSNYNDDGTYSHGNCGTGIVNFVDLIEVKNDNSQIDKMWHMLEAKNIEFDPNWNVFKWFLNSTEIENSIVMGYNKVLSSEESAQNFKALKGRFGI